VLQAADLGKRITVKLTLSERASSRRRPRATLAVVAPHKFDGWNTPLTSP
jgi:hypothetical protein